MPFGMNMMTPYPASIPVNGQAGIAFAAAPMAMKDSFPATNHDQAGLLQAAAAVGTVPTAALPPSQPGGSGQYIPAASTSDYGKYGISHHVISSDLTGNGAGVVRQPQQTMLLPTQSLDGTNTSGRGGASQTVVCLAPPLMGSSNNPQDVFSVASLSRINSVPTVEGGMVKDESSGSGGGTHVVSGPLGKLLSASGSMEGGNGGYPVQHHHHHHQHPLSVAADNSVRSVGGGSTVVTPSTSYIVMAPGVFPASSESVNSTNMSSFTSVASMTTKIGGMGGAVLAGGAPAGGVVVPIGTERAQKSATLSSSFSYPTGRRD